MALNTYNNNQKQITNTTYSNVVFSNGDSKLCPSRFSIAYFNKLMKVSIALRNNAGSNDAYATFDTENQVSVYVSPAKAWILAEMIDKMFTEGSDMHNVCVELKNGLLKVTDGTDFDLDHPCISISYADEAGNVNEVIYECKGASAYTGAYNYSDGEFSTESFPEFELQSIVMALREYYKASSYAIAASVMEAGMYKRNSQYEMIKAIADKVGAQTGSGNKTSFNNKTFLSASNNNHNTFSSGSNSSGGMNGIPKEYEASSFDDIAKGLD